MAGVSVKRINLDVGMHTGRTPCEDEDGNWGDSSISHGMPKTASKPPEDRWEAWWVRLWGDIRRKDGTLGYWCNKWLKWCTNAG